MGSAIAMRADFSSQKLRRLATPVRDAAQPRRLFAIAAVLDGAAREEAAKIGGMDRQILLDWVIRFNNQGPDYQQTIAVVGRQITQETSAGR